MKKRNWISAAFCVLVGTSASFIHIACGEAPEPKDQGPIVFQEEGVGFLGLPDGCSVAEPAGKRVEISCDLLETTKNPAGPAGRVHIEIGERREGHIDLEETSALEGIRLEQEQLYAALPGGEFKAAGGRLLYGPLGYARYSRGHYLGDDGTTMQQVRLFMVHPNDNRILSIVYDHPFVDKPDTSARINNHLFMLLGEMRGANEVQAEIDARGAGEAEADGGEAGGGEGTDTGAEVDESAAGDASTY